MRTDTPVPVRLCDYRPPDHLVETVDLDVSLDRHATRVRARIAFAPNPAGRPDADLRLDGDELTLVSIALDGRPLAPSDYTLTPTALTIARPPRRRFILDVETRIDPAANTKLSGLYRSGAAYCTQCEAEGFRRITFFPDRPDVMAVYTTRVEADRAEAPVLLANGDLLLTGAAEDPARHFAVWRDPWPKPSYLFALVAGDLACVSDRFTTMSGRSVDLRIYVEPGKEGRVGYAMDALKRAMRWDETAFGREYDLDTFMIVAVSDFNMGAMENKGLNVFNDKYILALPETATDQDHAAIEAIVAHEYFHNWTGNRITCRDWFQLCLKEGLTVFRDQEFTADQRSRAVKRISDVRNLRAMQFAEDAGPLAHPVRPEIYHEINNFYTSTVYEKGAELIRMLTLLIGADAFARGMDLYFTRCDGLAATVEDFLACFAEVSGRDLTDFARWYSQAGTPTLSVRWSHDPQTRRLIFDIAQATPATPGQPGKLPVVIPMRLGFIGRDGAEIEALRIEGAEMVGDAIIVTQGRQRVVVHDVDGGVTPSLLRGFSAPVRLDAAYSGDDLLMLARYDKDRFNRWQALQTYATRLLTAATGAIRNGETPAKDGRLLEALRHIVVTETDHAFVAQALSLPGETDIAREIGSDVDPAAIHAARRWLRRCVGLALTPELERVVQAIAPPGPYSPDAQAAGRRALRAEGLALLVCADPEGGGARAQALFESADNMTDRMAGLVAMSLAPGERRERALRRFESAYADEPLILDKWFSLQATLAEETTLDRVRALMAHPRFSIRNPNRLGALIGAFSTANPSQFNRADGAGFDLVVEVVMAVDEANPQAAARLLGAFRGWRALEAGRRGHAERSLRRVAARPLLSPDVADIVARCLA